MSAPDTSVQELVAAYHAARYAVRLRGGIRVELLVGEAVPRALAEVLSACAIGDCATGGLITAWNPYSVPATRDDNRRRQRELLPRLRGASAVVHAGAGWGAGWREPGFAPLGIASGALDALAREFRQNAILTFSAGERVRLRLYPDEWRAALRDADVDFAPTT
jgi:hypothetical protein